MAEMHKAGLRSLPAHGPMTRSRLFLVGTPVRAARPPHSTVTLFARLRGLSTSVPRAQAVW